jgi:hypothetical protein
MARKYSLPDVMTALRTRHGLVSLAAGDIGCSRATLYNYIQEFPEVAAIIADERERLIDLAEDALYRHVEEGAPWAVALVLKTLGRHRGYGDRPPAASPEPEAEALTDTEVIVIKSQAGSNGRHG